MNLKEKYKIWIEALRSGKYEQARESLCVPLLDEDLCEIGEYGYCCLGIADKVVFDTVFRNQEIDGVVIVVDNLGAEEQLPKDREIELNLDEPYTEEDLELARRIYPDFTLEPSKMERSRMYLLSDMNDEGASFEEIADFLEQCGWDEEDE